MRKLSKSLDEYLENDGWSSHLFLPIAKQIIPQLIRQNIKVEIGRSVIHLQGKTKLKCYVHHNGRSNQYLTITDNKGKELKTFHYTEDASEIFGYILKESK